MWKKMIFLLITVIWMGFIFFMSSKPAVESSGISEGLGVWLAELLRPDHRGMPETEWMAYVDVVHTVVRKIAHFTEYALLGVWLAMDVWLWSAGRWRMKHVLVVSWLAGTLYALSDEFHQMFVEGRSGELFDVMIDSAGVLTGVAFICVVIRLIWKKMNNNKENISL